MDTMDRDKAARIECVIDVHFYDTGSALSQEEQGKCLLKHLLPVELDLIETGQITVRCVNDEDDQAPTAEGATVPPAKGTEWDKVYNWMRKPDWIGGMNHQDLIAWANERPLMQLMAIQPDARETFLLKEIENHCDRKRVLYEEAHHYKDALSDLLEAIMESDWQELEAGCDGAGPIVKAHQILELPFSDELVEYLAPDAVDLLDEE
ncbi:hypothetical protein RYZ26_15415 [Terasakiella sp. A23]|uniref:hypothetical protein n=1 Tax=Terasakiella sp. FCG-A23 TaxID=3080561 RepID=UPI00295401ED|nr:hypothetical protein [Terasakiella sp. A23]MDV7340994.1 hypothetical protein [Terasakiella sp. A23]